MLQKKADSYCIFWLIFKRQDACVEFFLNVLYVTLCAPCTFKVHLKCPITDRQSLHAYLFQICILNINKNWDSGPLMSISICVIYVTEFAMRK